MTLPLSPIGRRYGYIRTAPDHRDYGTPFADLSPLPPVIDLESFCGPVKDQGALGACTAFAGCGNREYLARWLQASSPILSPLYLYYYERKMNGTLPEDSGSDGRTDCRVMHLNGICEESADQYDPSKFNNEPTPDQIANAAQWRAGAYHALGNVQDMKSCLASNYPVLIGFAVYPSFERIGSDGIWNYVDGESMLGGHEVLVIGYDDTRQAFKARNSWGPNWGDHGNFWFPYDVAAKVIWDRFIQHLGKAW